MKRDMELIRRVLLEVEARPDAHTARLQLPEYPDAVVSHHVGLLVQAGLLEGQSYVGSDEEDWYPSKLTWEGHEFLDNIRNDAVWKEVTRKVTATGGSAGLAIRGSSHHCGDGEAGCDAIFWS